MIIKMNHLKHRNRAATNTRIGTIMRTVSWQYSWVSTQRCSHFPIESNVCIFSTLIIKFSLHQSNWCMMWSEKFFSLTCKRSLDSFGVFDLLHKAIVCGKSIECLKEFWMEFFSALRSEEFVANLKSKKNFFLYIYEKKNYHQFFYRNSFLAQPNDCLPNFEASAIAWKFPKYLHWNLRVLIVAFFFFLLWSRFKFLSVILKEEWNKIEAEYFRGEK